MAENKKANKGIFTESQEMSRFYFILKLNKRFLFLYKTLSWVLRVISTPEFCTLIFFNNEVVNSVKQLGYSQQIWHKEGEDNGLN